MELLQLSVNLPIYRSCRINFCLGIAAYENPTLKFWYCNYTTLMRCFFKNGQLSDMTLNNAAFSDISPLMEYDSIPYFFLKSFSRETICEALRKGYYVFANNCADMFYLGNYPHSLQDCLISGFNDYSETYTVSSCFFRERSKYVTYQAFEKAINNSACKYLLILKPTYAYEHIKIDLIMRDLRKYLSNEFNSEINDSENGFLLGISLYDVMTDYIKSKNFNYRLYELFCEHKKCMEYRIEIIEKEFKLNDSASTDYKGIVNDIYNAGSFLMHEDTRIKTLSLLTFYKQREASILKRLIN